MENNADLDFIQPGKIVHLRSREKMSLVFITKVLIGDHISPRTDTPVYKIFWIYLDTLEIGHTRAYFTAHHLFKYWFSSL
jgi:hypothetical protein